jgi:hypothetical protein
MAGQPDINKKLAARSPTHNLSKKLSGAPALDYYAGAPQIMDMADNPPESTWQGECQYYFNGTPELLASRCNLSSS